MDKASDKNTGSRKIDVPDHSSDNSNDTSFLDIFKDHEESEKNPSDISDDPILSIPEALDPDPETKRNGFGPFGISGGVGLLKSNDFSESINIDLSFGSTGDISRFEVFIGGAWAGVDDTSKLDDSIESGVFLFNLGLNYKRKIAEPPKWHSPYFISGISYKHMFWDYENDIYTTENDVIHRDSLEGIEILAGVGKNIFQIKEKKFGMEIYPSVIFWFSQTTEGFDNDVFDPFIFLNIRFIISSW